MSNNNFNGNNLPQTTNGNNPFEIFNYKNLGSVRCYIDQFGMKWFCMNDVCAILEIANPRDTLKRLDPKGVVTTDTLTNGGIQQVKFINEGNLMELSFSSKKRQAKEFRSWVCHELLPQLSSKGYYVMNNVTPATVLLEMSKLVYQHDNRIQTLEQSSSDFSVRMDEVERIQRQLIETGYISVKSFIVYHSLDTNTFDPAYLGRTASHMCNAQGIPMGTEPSDNWNFVNTYPYQVLFEAYQKIMFNKMHN